MRKVKENKDCEWFEIDGGDLIELEDMKIKEKKFSKKFVELEKGKR